MTNETQTEPAAPPSEASTEAMSSVPRGPILGAITFATVAVGLLGHAIVWGIQRFAGGMPETNPAWAWVGAGAVWVAFMAGTFAIRPWRSMPMTRWAALWLAGRGICFIATILAGVAALYSAPQENRALIGLVMAGGYLGVLAAETAVVAKALQRGRGDVCAGDSSE